MKTQTMKTLNALLMTGLAALAAKPAAAATFDELWNRGEAESKQVRAAKAESRAAHSAAQRGGRHWFPRLVLTSQAVSSNDPATNLFSTLGSRTLQASDLSPSLMNQPARQWFGRGTLGLDWALFEGGSRVAHADAAELSAQARDAQQRAAQNAEFSQWVQHYADWLAVASQTRDAEQIKIQVSQAVQRYRVGSKENPVGYSGWLGLQALEERVESVLEQNRSEMLSHDQWFVVRVGESPTLSTHPPLEFLKSKLQSDIARVDEKVHSHGVRAAELTAQAQQRMSDAEKAKFLPRVGLFANGNLVSAPRDVGTSLEFGAYLQWELFNPTQWGGVSEAQQGAQAADYRAQAQREQGIHQVRSLQEQLKVMVANEKRSRRALELTAEQVVVAEKLFRSGSISALQFVEVLSRRLDALQSHRTLETSASAVYTALYNQLGN